MKPTFSPGVYFVVNSKSRYVLLQAPHEVRERAWNILNMIYDDHVVEKRGGEPTQITITPFPGYTNETAFSITTAAAYLAVKNASLEDIWRVTPENHFQKMNGILGLEIPEMYDFKVEFEPFKYMLEAYISRLTTTRLNNTLTDAFRNTTWNIRYFEDMRDEVVECYRRLAFSEVKTNMVQLRPASCDSSLFSNAIDQAAKANDVVAKIKGECQQAINTFILSLSRDEPNLLERWQYLIETFPQRGELAKEVHNTVDLDGLEASLLQIRLVTPAEPPTPIIKK